MKSPGRHSVPTKFLEVKARLLELADAGHTITYCAQEVGIDRGTLDEWRRNAAQWPSVREFIEEFEERRVAASPTEGNTSREVLALYVMTGVNVYRVKRFFTERPVTAAEAQLLTEACLKIKVPLPKRANIDGCMTELQVPSEA